MLTPRRSSAPDAAGGSRGRRRPLRRARGCSTSRRSSPRRRARPTSAAPSTSGSTSSSPPARRSRAPLAGVVHRLANNRAPQDYGPLVILRHAAGEGTTVLHALRPPERGHPRRPHARPARRQRARRSGASARRPRNGDWPPHLHFQLILDLLELDADFPGVALASRARALDGALARPEPARCGIPAERFPRAEPGRDETLARPQAPRWDRACASPTAGRSRSCAASAATSTTRPAAPTSTSTTTCRSWATATRAWSRAVQAQLALLNTNTRYLHDTCAALRASGSPRSCPEPLARLLLRELGQRGQRAGAAPGARAHRRRGRDRARARVPRPHDDARRREPLQVRRARAGSGRKPTSCTSRRCPTTTAAATGATIRDAGSEVRAATSGEIVERDRGGRPRARRLPRRDAAERRRPDRLPARLPRRGLPPRARGRAASCIADEVQVGFGRLGSALLGLRDAGRGARHRRARQADRQRLPARGGGHHAARSPRPSTTAWSSSAPSAATRWPARPGSPCSTCSSEEQLQENALRVGGPWLIAGSAGLQERHPLVGDVRGSGLFLGVELVRDRATREPAREEAAYVVEPPARARRPRRHRRPLRQRAQAAAAARLLGRGRGALPRDPRRGAPGGRRAGLSLRLLSRQRLLTEPGAVARFALEQLARPGV